MFKQHIYDNPHLKVVFETAHPVLFSILQDGAFEKTWKPWKLRYFALRQDGTLVYRKNKQSSIKAKLDLTNTRVKKVALEESPSKNPLLQVEYGISVSCFRDGIPTSFRCILSEKDWLKFHEAITTHVVGCDIDDSLINIRSSIDSSSGHTQSTMRAAITRAMDRYDRVTNKEIIMRRRGALKWLPIYRANDLVLGSWWFVVGSVMMVITSAIVLANDYNPMLGEDDSTLSPSHYRGSWVLMIVSGLFFTLGSLAFVRALHESPPMKPLFTWKHVASDELLGSWLFFFACVPFFPYALIYMSEADPPHKPLYIVLISSDVGALIAIAIIILGCFLFVLSCYPSLANEKPRSTCLPFFQSCLCLCFSQDFITTHMANDWLAGCWLLMWGSVAASLAAFFLTIYALADNQHLQIFIFSTTFVENVIFLIGSAYFVAGSYPEDAEEVAVTGLLDKMLLDDRSSSHDISMM